MLPSILVINTCTADVQRELQPSVHAQEVIAVSHSVCPLHSLLLLTSLLESLAPADRRHAHFVITCHNV